VQYSLGIIAAAMKSDWGNRLRILVITLALAGLAGCGGSSNNDSVVLTPELTDLTVAGAKTDLNPVFDSDVVRYSVLADELASGITITASAVETLLISINDTLVPSDTPVAVDPANPGDIIDIEVQNTQGDTRLYELVYLPPDFPELTTTVLSENVAPGVLYFSFSGPGLQYVAIVDNYGVPIFYRGEEQRVSDFKRHPSGERSYAIQTEEENECDRTLVEEIILGPGFVESERVATIGLTHTDSHDFLITENGNHVPMAYDCRLRDMTPYGGEPEQLVEDSVIQEIDESKQVVFEWNSWEKMGPEGNLRPDPSDYAHVNSVFEDFDGNLIVSARGISQVAKIDRMTGEMIWRLGGTSNEFTFVDDPFSNLCGQHTASRLENGNILIFDNGQYCWPENEARGELTRVVEYELDQDQMTARLVWSYSHETAYTLAAGSAQRLANGNTLIGWGRGPAIVATEVDANGTKTLEMTASANGETVRSYRARRFLE
jgi:hypothetical protein